jgi:hypothetical protein
LSNPGGSPATSVLRNGRDVDPTKPRVRIVEADDEDDMIAPGPVDARSMDDLWLPVGHVRFPEGHDAIAGVPILRGPDGKQVPQLVISKPVQNNDGQFAVDANGNPIFIFFTMGIDLRGNAWAADNFRVDGRYVAQVEILDLDMIEHDQNASSVRAMYVSVHSQYNDFEFGEAGLGL